MAKYTLPELRYPTGALEPHISGKILELHHGKHHAAYVKGANAALDALSDASGDDAGRVAALERALAFNLSGHVLHSLFWRNLTPNGGGRPTQPLDDALQRDFGGFEKFKARMIDVASSVMGSGWAALIWEPLAGRLLTTQVYDHQSNLAQGGVPLMVIDAWEHAYYLQYQNRKAEYVEAIWSCWNWQDIGQRFVEARGGRADIG